jgi:hypothetical protein
MPKAMRKNLKNRKTRITRKTRRTNMRNTRNMYGGALVLSPMELTDTSMVGASKMSSAQGIDFFAKHAAQHGGSHLMGAPVGDTGMLDAALRGSARVEPLDASYKAVVGMKDQSGGKRRAATRRSTKRRSGTRRATMRRATMRRANMRRATMRRMYGGAALGFAPSNAPGMLLDGKLASQALGNMNQEWQLAKDPHSFAPKM